MKNIFTRYIKTDNPDYISINDDKFPISCCDDNDCFLPLILLHILHLQHNFGDDGPLCLKADFFSTTLNDSLLSLEVKNAEILNNDLFETYLECASSSINLLISESNTLSNLIFEIRTFVDINYLACKPIQSTMIIKHLLSPLHHLDASYSNNELTLPLNLQTKSDQITFDTELEDELMATTEGTEFISNCLVNTSKLVVSSSPLLLSLLKQIAIITVAQALTENKLNDFSYKPNKHDISPVDEEVLLAAILGVPELLTIIASEFNSLSNLLVFPKSVYELRENVFSVFEHRTFDANSGCNKSWFDYAEKYCRYLQMNDVVKSCFKYILSTKEQKLYISENSIKKAFLASKSEQLIKFVETNSSIKKLDNLRHTKKIKQSLLNSVIGQNDAINSVVNGLRASVIQAESCLKGIFTFFGESGTGKTYLAKELAFQFSSTFNNGYKTTTFNMENYADKRDNLKLFGSGQQYADSLVGQLTAEVAICPRQFIIFDEIEKAHPRVIQSLLTLLDTGVAKDYTMNRAIDFTQCYIVFTSNLGQKEIRKAFENNAPINPFDLIRNDEKSFSAELINRLAKGEYSVFKKLNAKALLKITSKAAHNAVQDNSSLIKWSERSESNIINSLSYDISPRTINAQVSKLNSEVLSKVEPVIDELNSKQLNNITLTAQSKPQNKVNILCFTDSNPSLEFTEENVVICSGKIKYFINLAINGTFDAVLIDEVYLNKETDGSIEDISALIAKQNEDRLICSFNNLTSKNSLVTEKSVDYQFKLNGDSNQKLNATFNSIQYLVNTLKEIKSACLQPKVSNYDYELSTYEAGINVSLKNINKYIAFDSSDLLLPFVNYADVPEYTTKDVIGLTQAKDRLLKVSQWLQNDSELSRFNIDIPRGYLLAGSPGSGKTFLAKAIAGECELPFFNVNASDLTIGDPDKNIKDLFNMLEKYQPAILFIDEIDSIATVRNQSPLQTNRVVNSLLVALDGFNKTANKLFVLAATNFPESIDPALKRSGRLEETLFCELPNKNQRIETIERLTNKHSISLLPEQLSELTSITKGASVAFLEKMFRESFYNKSDKSAWQYKDIKTAYHTFTLGNESEPRKPTQNQLLKVAYHEVGHLIAQKSLFPEQEVSLITIQPRRNSLGSVSIVPDENQGNLSRTELKKRLQVLLAGRAAEILMLGDDAADTGATNDISVATSMVKQAITKGGLSESLGLVDFSLFKCAEKEVFIEVQNWLSEGLTQVTKLLRDNAKLLEKLTILLINNESLDRLFINKIFIDFNKSKSSSNLIGK